VGPRDGLDRCGKSRPPPGFDPRTVQPVASRYTALRYPVHFLQVHYVKLNLIFMVLDFFLIVYGCNSITITSNISTLSIVPQSLLQPSRSVLTVIALYCPH